MEVTSLFHQPLSVWFEIISGLFAISAAFLVQWWRTGAGERAKKRDMQARMNARLKAINDTPKQTLDEKFLSPLLNTSIGTRLRTLVEQAGIRERPTQVLLTLLIVLAGCAIVGAFIRTAVSGLIVGIVLDAIVVFWLRYRASKAMQEFTEQLPEVFQALATALRVGQSPTQAIDYVSRHLPDPAASEFRRISRELRSGAVFSHALQRLLERRPSSDLEIGVNAILIQTEVGGSLASVLDSLANMIRVRRRAEADIRIATQQVRSTVYIVAGLVPALALIMNIESPGYLAPLFTPGLGIFLLLVAVVCVFVGVGWTLYLVRVKY